MSRTVQTLAAAFALSVSAAALARAADLTKVTIVQMHPAIGVGEEVFMYAVPKQLGYFKDEGLDVGVQGVSGGGAAVQILENGGAQFGTTVPESVLQVREQGGDPVAIYSLKRTTGSIIIVPEDSPIRTLKDLKGKTIGGMSFGAGGGLAVKEKLGQLGIAPDQYSTVTTGAGPAAVAALRSKQIDALVLWDAMRGAAENTGMKLRPVELPDQDKIGAMTFATTDRYIKAHPEVVKGMCRAVAKGLHFALANPAAAIKLFWKEFPTTKPSGDEATGLRDQMHILNRWFEASEAGLEPGKETGDVRPATWQVTEDTYVKAGVLKGVKPASEGYTTAFTPACNDYDRAAIETQAKAAD